MADATIENGNGWTGKAKAAGTFVNQVGLPAVLILFVLWVVWAVLTKRIDSPVVTHSEFQQHVTTNDQIHDALIKNATANTEAIKQTTKVLSGMNCDHKATASEKLECFKDLKTDSGN